MKLEVLRRDGAVRINARLPDAVYGVDVTESTIAQGVRLLNGMLPAGVVVTEAEVLAHV